MKFAGYDTIILTGKASRPTIVWIHGRRGRVRAGRQVSRHEDLADRGGLARRPRSAGQGHVGGPGGRERHTVGLPFDRPVSQGRPRRRRRPHGHEERQGGRFAGHRLGDASATRAPSSPISTGCITTTSSRRPTCGRTKRARLPSSTRSTEVGRCPRGTTRRACSRVPTRSTPRRSRRSASRSAPATSARSAAGTSTKSGTSRCEGPEFETIALCGSNCAIDDIEALTRFNVECDEWGLDTISTGSVVALAMDLTERAMPIRTCASETRPAT